MWFKQTVNQRFIQLTTRAATIMADEEMQVPSRAQRVIEHNDSHGKREGDKRHACARNTDGGTATQTAIVRPQHEVTPYRRGFQIYSLRGRCAPLDCGCIGSARSPRRPRSRG